MAVFSGPEIVNSGLVLHLDAANSKSYPGSGTTWTDLSGQGNNGTLVNGVGYSTDNKGAMVFDGVDDYVDCGSSTSYTFTNSLTLGAWCSSGSGTSFKSIIMRTTGNGWGDRYGIYQYAGNLYFWVNVWNAPQTVSVSRSVFSARYIVGVYDGTNLKLYENGSLVATGSAYTANVVNPNTSLNLGRGGSLYYWDGSVAQAHVYNRALTAAEILQNFNALRGRYGI